MSDAIVKKPVLDRAVFLIVSVSLCIATFMQILDFSIANVCVPYIAGDLGVSNANGTWVVTMFAVGNSIGVPMSGWLSKQFGTVRTLCVSILLFTITSWICGVSFFYPMLVMARFFQGLVSGPLIPLSQSLLVYIFPKDRETYAIALWNLIALLGPILGPIVGGWIVKQYTWEWIFLINIPIGILATLILWLFLRKHETPTQSTRFDYMGLALLAISVTALQVLLDRGQQYDWFNSKTIIALCVISVICFIFHLVWEYTEKHPVIDYSLFKNRNFSLGTIFMSVTYFFLFGSIVITPLWLQTNMGYIAYDAGLAVATMGIFPFFFLPITAKLVAKYSNRMLLGICLICFCLSYYLFMHFTTEVSFAFVAFSRFVFGIGISFYYPPLMNLSFAQIRHAQMPMATGIFHFYRILLGGIGASVFVTLWQRRQAVHQSHITSVLTPFQKQPQQILESMQRFGVESKQALGILYQEIIDQSSMLATNDIFYLSLIIFLVLIPFIFVFKRRVTSEH